MLLKYPSPEGFLAAVAQAPVTVDQWQLEKLALVAREKEIVFCTPGVPQEFRPAMWGPVFNSFAPALEATLAGLPASARVAVIPEGPYVLARVEEPVLA
jgi:molybdopterin-biosynthesis enzyme MoeA-like protein